MNFIKRLAFNTNRLIVGDTNKYQSAKDTVGYATISLEDEKLQGKQAIYPQWFFSARLGQPRGVDIEKIRRFAKSSWVQIVLNTFKKQMYCMEWDIVPEDEDEDSKQYEEKIKKVKEFFRCVNKSKQSVDYLNSELISDIGEIDAGVVNFIYTSNSYDIGEVPIYDMYGRVLGNDTGLVLKPFGQRELAQLKTVDGGSILKQVDLHKNLQRYYQYSFKHPRQNPTAFEFDELEYLIMNPRSYSVYGFSGVQAIQQVLELLIEGTRYNKDLFVNNATPSILATLPKLPNEQLKKLKRMWNNEYKGKPHKVGFVNWSVENFHKLAENNRDLEWLDGQKWYFKIVFAIFGVSPTEAGFFENSNKSNDDGQERVTIRNALKPYIKLIEDLHNNRTIKEILQEEEPGIKFIYKPKDHAKEKIEFEHNMQELNNGVMTINEYRAMQGKDDVEWGDEPLRRPMDPNMTSFTPFGNKPKEDNKNPKKDDKEKNKDKYSKSFERFLENGK